MSCTAIAQEAVFGFGREKQSDLVTGNLIAEILRLSTINAVPIIPAFTTEDDSDESGNGHDFPSNNFAVSKALTMDFEAYLTSYKMAWLSAFCLGATVKTGAGPFTYTSTPLDRAVDGCELPAFSILQQVRGTDVLDQLLIGNVVNSFQVEIASGPGRASSRVTANILGIGKVTDPSTLTMPALTAESLLSSASLALSANGVDYVATKRIKSLTWGFNNNVDSARMFFPGSGLDGGFAIGGRMEVDKREASLSFVADFDDTQDEITKLIAQTEGTAVISQSFSASEEYTATFHRITFGEITANRDGNRIEVAVTCKPLYDSVNGILTVAADTAIDNIAA